MNAGPGTLVVEAFGAAMLSPGIWQSATGVGVDIGEGALVHASFRFSPGARWEFQSGFTATVRDPFDTTGIGFALGGSWRMTPRSGPFAAKRVGIRFYHHPFGLRFGEPEAGGAGEAAGVAFRGDLL